ncbi:hypothetical protein GH741_16485 [Aquibacillus halophilus]|uniref:Phosphonate C-P lyase system protein PhnH n=1 Tax=Aquibacillus halophilus TaxID=930132 RepID=A0A6A8DSR0_9BACI|nr:phosphonate C-P lyase system protein PhnH [Aquibacillus halophilus]MRH44242.1 hypothetical protein [Aquibacillus halophilus]
MLSLNQAFLINEPRILSCNKLEFIKKVHTFHPHVTIEVLQSLGLSKPLATIALTILNEHSNFACLSSNGLEISQFLEWKTKARIEDLNYAQYILLPEQLQELEIHDTIGRIFPAPNLHPRESVTLILQVDHICKPTDHPGLILYITDEDTESKVICSVRGLKFWWIAERQIINSQYQKGIDMIVVDQQGRYIFIPHTARIEVE